MWVPCVCTPAVSAVCKGSNITYYLWRFEKKTSHSVTQISEGDGETAVLLHFYSKLSLCLNYLSILVRPWDDHSG